MVRPVLEYGQSVWYPHLLKQSRALEGVQRRATKMVRPIENLSYKERLNALKLPSLYYRRLRGDLILVYKFLSSNSISDTNPLLVLSGCTNTRGHDLKLYKEACNSNARKFSFSQRVVSYWNNLHYNTVHATNINNFKKLLDDELKDIKYNFD